MKKFCVVCILMILTHDLAHFSFRAVALRCNLCVSKGLGNPCTPSVQTCLPHITNCGYIKFKPTLLGSAYIRSCISLETCWNYMSAATVTAKCCNTDLCN
ncbi:uncharacterized protein si:dkeyp-80c12.8 [Megalobrama amblycephala]|uniref:uncharacterized protein si:dkeyp-80c12.8 n=1 Tax=Megalobrama amblycephala TaxID=75352 RepID=UPI002014418E|nr:uncharacterized protein si:dkeyp-80c12.8 [Megalobrama amblycephala]